MITMLGSPRRSCDGLTRRETLQAGSLGLVSGLLGSAGSNPGPLAASEPAANLRQGPAKSVIVLYLLGGAPGQDMWDMKPNAPKEVRGEFNPIATKVPGIEVSEHLPRLAQWMDRCAVVRSLHHKAGCHNPLPSYTGYEVPLDNLVTTKDSYPPSMGSVCEFLKTGREEDPAYVYLPNYLGWGQSIRRPGPYAGFLGQKYEALYTECQPTVDTLPDLPYKGQPLRGMPVIPNTQVNKDGVTIDRLASRRTLLQQLDQELLLREQRGKLGLYNRESARAWSLLTDSKVRAAFDLEQETPELKAKYTNTLFGQSALIARRLVQTGVQFINVTWDVYWERLQLQYDGWDTHVANFKLLKDYNLPYFDQAFSALMEDLQNHGLLDETLVVVMSEMGRTPRINGNAGRDHWTFCQSMLLAGAGIRGGTVYGASDAEAAYPKEMPVSTGDICATIYQCLGIDPESTVPDITGRPMNICQGGQPLWEILAT